MATEIWRDFDPNLAIPEGLKNARVSTSPDRTNEYPDPDANIDIQTETFDDEGSELDEDGVGFELDVPGTFEVVSQTVRTGPDGSQVVDVVIEIEDVNGAVNYEVRMSK